MATPRPLNLPTRYYRIKASGAHDGATCFLRPAQALGHGLPDPLPAYVSVDRECRPVEVPLADVLGIEEV